MADTGKTTRMSEQLRARIMQQAGMPIIGASYESQNMLQEGAAKLGEGLAKRKDTMGGSTGRTEEAFQAQRAGEREAASQFGDDKEKIGAAMARSMGGSKTFTKKEVRRGYRKL